jgi:dienelactone hydrolase
MTGRHVRAFRSTVVVIAVVATAAACGGSGGGDAARPRAAPTPTAGGPPRARLFAYDRAAPLGRRDGRVINRGYPVKIHDVSYASPRGGRVQGFLVLPPGRGPFPAVVYLHGSGGSRLDLVAPATWLAARRAVALTIDSPFSRVPRPRVPSGLAGLRKERDLAVQTVIDLRRAVDLLQSLPQVDDDRIGFVGFSAGAKSGAILTAVERRIRAFVLMSGGAASAASFVRRAPPRLRPEVSRILAQTDPLRYVGHAAPAALFFQNGLSDTVVPRSALAALSKAGSRPKRVRWYRADHALNAQAFRDQLAWLSDRLGIRGPPVPGTVTGPS